MEMIKPSESKDTRNNALKIFWLSNISVIDFLLYEQNMEVCVLLKLDYSNMRLFE